MKLAVLGSPVAHSLSPVMHRAALAAVGISGTYVAIEVDAASFASELDGLRKGDLDGANVTMPHKSRAFSLCDVRSRLAERAGAVNTLVLRDSELVGENTDVSGIRSAWRWAQLPEEAPINIVGSGGAAAAALIALEGRELRITARRESATRGLVESTGVQAAVVPWGETMSEAVLVNATPIGMRGEQLPKYLLNSAVGLFDMAYGDAPTPAVVVAQRSGMPVAVGLDMLIGQAVSSFGIWTGYDIEPSVMRVAAEQELSRRKETAQ
ncbi:MAG: shikimate dehydrogenase [bacterium]|nr:shikimate dehydrogenase [bacterium]